MNKTIKIALSVSVLVCLCLGGAFGFKYYRTTTPEFALEQIQHAVTTHDIALFDRHVDLDAVLSSAIDDAIAAEPSSKVLGVFLTEKIKPTLVDKARSLVRRSIETVGTAASPTPVGNLLNASVLSVTEAGVLMEAKLSFPYKGEPIHVSVTLRRDDRYFRVIRVNDVGQIVAQIEEIDRKREVEANAAVREELEARVPKTLFQDLRGAVSYNKVLTIKGSIPADAPAEILVVLFTQVGDGQDEAHVVRLHNRAGVLWGSTRIRRGLDLANFGKVGRLGWGFTGVIVLSATFADGSMLSPPYPERIDFASLGVKNPFPKRSAS